MERHIVMVGGSPASGKSRLCKSMVSELRFEMSIAHLSAGDTVRSIGRGAVRSHYTKQIQEHLNSSNPSLPINDTIMHRVLTESLESYDEIDTLLVDGYPRYLEQVDDMYDLAKDSFRSLTGLIVTHVPENEAVLRMIKRRPRDYEDSFTISTAQERLKWHEATFNEVVLELQLRDMPIEIIDTTGLRVDTTEVGLLTLRHMLSPNDTQQRDAS